MPRSLRNLRNNELRLFGVLTVVGDRASPTMGFLCEWEAGCTEPGRVVISNEVPFERAGAHQECCYDRNLLSHLSRCGWDGPTLVAHLKKYFGVKLQDTKINT